MTVQVNTIQAKEMVSDILSAGLVAMLHSSPGMGKSAIVKELAQEFNLKLIDFRLSQCEVTDLLGFPEKNPESGKFHYMPMDIFPLEGEPIPDGYSGWLLFFDELTSADRSVQKGAYKILLDRMIGQLPLHKNVALVAAGNLMTDNAIVEEMGTALQSRLIHLELYSDHEAWLQWASKNGIQQMITSFIAFQPDLLNNFKSDHSDKTFACQRTWEFANKLLNVMTLKGKNLFASLAGTISEGVARQFIAFTQLYGQLPSMTEILANPAGTTMPTEPGVLYALTGSVGAYAEASNLPQMLTYVKRMPAEFQVVCLREIVRRNAGKNIMKDPAIKAWLAVNGVELF